MTARLWLTVDARMSGDSGIGTYIRELVPRIVALRPDWQFTLMVKRGAPDDHAWATSPNVDLIECASPIYSVTEQIELVRRAPRGADLFWSPHYNIPLAYRGPLFVTIHDVFHIAMARLVPGIHRRMYARHMFRAVRRKAAAIVCNSEFTRGEILRYTGRGGTHPEVTPLGVDSDWFDVARGPGRERPYIIFVGNVKPHKNLGRLLTAFAAIADRIPHDLLIVGRREGMQIADEETQTRARASGSRVVFTGEIAGTALRSLVAGADVMVFPSLYEGFGLPPLEAMAAGTPCIVSRAASIPEVCGDAALYIDPFSVTDIGERIIELLGNRTLQQQLREAGVRRAREFTWGCCAQQTLAVIDRQLNSGSS